MFLVLFFEMGKKCLGKTLLELKHFHLNISSIIDLPCRAPFITLDSPAFGSVYVTRGLSSCMQISYFSINSPLFICYQLF
jgi:hypothetical protein